MSISAQAGELATVTVNRPDIAVSGLLCVGGDGEDKQVSHFQYLGYTVTSDGKCDTEIKKRITISNDYFISISITMRNKINHDMFKGVTE